MINVKPGDKAMVNFPALPGQVFEAEVILVPGAIGNAQSLASGQLPSVEQLQTTRLYPVYISFPEDFPEELRKVGLAASVTIHTEGAGVVGIVAVVLQWVSTSLDAIICRSIAHEYCQFWHSRPTGADSKLDSHQTGCLSRTDGG